jgi:transposase
VKSLYLPPYCPDFNPIEGFFAELKVTSRRLGQRRKRILTEGFMPSFGGAFMTEVENRREPKAISDV